MRIALPSDVANHELTIPPRILDATHRFCALVFISVVLSVGQRARPQVRRASSAMSTWNARRRSDSLTIACFAPNRDNPVGLSVAK